MFPFGTKVGRSFATVSSSCTPGQCGYTRISVSSCERAIEHKGDEHLLQNRPKKFKACLESPVYAVVEH